MHEYLANPGHDTGMETSDAHPPGQEILPSSRLDTVRNRPSGPGRFMWTRFVRNVRRQILAQTPVTS